MIRHSSSFFVSLVFHIILAFALYLTYKTIFFSEKKKEKETRIKIELCNIQTIQKEISKPSVKPEVIPEKIPKKIPLKKIQKKLIKKVKAPPQKPIIKVKPVSKVIPLPEVVEKVIYKEELIIIPTREEKEELLEKQYIDNNIQKITQLLSDNLYYPRSARKRGITGTILVQFTLSTSASIHSISIIKSNSEVLSRAAIQTIENLSGVFPKPQEDLTLNVPIEYKLRR